MLPPRSEREKIIRIGELRKIVRTFHLAEVVKLGSVDLSQADLLHSRHRGLRNVPLQ